MAVDDNHHMLQVLRTMLNSMGMSDVRLFADAGVALQDLRIAPPDVIFTDWLMSPMTGGEFVSAIRDENGPVRYTPVIVLTAHASRAMVRQARDHGVDYTLCKPVSVEYCYRAFAQLLHGDRSFVQVGKYFGPDRRRKARPFEFNDRRREDPIAAENAAAAASG
ncbi:MAG: response regulator [Alphaproteobacteria bacterium]